MGQGADLSDSSSRAGPAEDFADAGHAHVALLLHAHRTLVHLLFLLLSLPPKREHTEEGGRREGQHRRLVKTGSSANRRQQRSDERSAHSSEVIATRHGGVRGRGVTRCARERRMGRWEERAALGGGAADGEKSWREGRETTRRSSRCCLANMGREAESAAPACKRAASGMVVQVTRTMLGGDDWERTRQTSGRVVEATAAGQSVRGDAQSDEQCAHAG